MGEPEKEEGKEDPEKKEDSGSSEENKEEGSQDSEQKKPFQNLDLKEWHCFGIQHPKSTSWIYLSILSRTDGWRGIDPKKLEHSLKINVDSSYLQLASFLLVDLDDDVPYHCWFDNQNYLWRVEITNSPDAEIDIETAQNFFNSEMFKKIAERTEIVLKRSIKEYNEVIEPHLRNGELLEVDEVKLDAIMYLLSQKVTLDNVREGKWMKF